MANKLYMSLLVLLAGSLTTAIGTETFTLSDEGLMVLDVEHEHIGATTSVSARRDVPGPGVEFDIYFPGVKLGDRMSECLSVKGRGNKTLVGIDVGQYDAFQLKFTIVSVNGEKAEGSGGKMWVGAKIGCEGGKNWGFYPVEIGFGKADLHSATSTTGTDGDLIQVVGWTAYITDPNGWSEEGMTVTILIEPAPEAVQIPQKKIRKEEPAEGKYIYVDSSAEGNNTGSDWSNAFQSLSDALESAQVGDQIWVAEGIYKPNKEEEREATFKLKKEVSLYGGFPKGGGTWEQSNPVQYETILSGDLKGNDAEATEQEQLAGHTSRIDNCFHVVTASGTDKTTLLDGFVISGGNANGNLPDKTDSGGGLYARSGSPLILNCVFRNNAAKKGGAVSFWMSDSMLSYCMFNNNSAQEYGGGVATSQANITLVSTVLTNNWARERGGAVYIENCKPAIINCTVADNYSYAGGGIFSERSSPTLSNCIVWGNRSRYGTGEPAQIYGVKINANHCCIQEMTDELGGTGNIVNNPRFADAANGDYRPTAGSACIDAGDNKAVPTDVTTDFDGNARISGTTVDMGAYEYGR